MSDSYHYDEGANHYDNKKVLHIDKVPLVGGTGTWV